MWRSRKPSSTFSWKKIQRIASFGDGQRMENTQPRVPMQYNFRGLLVNWKWCRYGKPRWNKKCNFFAWTLLHKKILIAHNLMKRNGHMIQYASSVEVIRKCQHTYVKIVFFQSESRRHSSSGLGLLPLIPCERKVRSTTIGVDAVQRLKASRGKILMAS